MVEYYCTTCWKKFNKRSNWNHHCKKRKYPCKKKNKPENLDERLIIERQTKLSDIDETTISLTHIYSKKDGDKKSAKSADCESFTSQVDVKKNTTFQCPMCDLILSSKFSLQRHLGKLSCPKMKNMLIESGLFVEESNEKNVINNINTLNNGTYNNNNLSIDNSNNITNNNLQLSDYSAKNYDSIPIDVTKKCLGNGFDMVPKLIKHTHCNDKYPQYRNIRVTNLRSSHIDVRENGVWKKKRKGRTILQLMHDAHNHLESVHDSLEDEDYKGKSKAERYFNAFFNDQEKTEKRITDDIVDHIYNETQLLKK